MASIVPGTSVNKAHRRIYFSLNRRRHAVRFPAMDWTDALLVLHRIEDLVNCKIANTTPKRETSKWLAGVDASLHKRLAETGLIDGRVSELLGEYLAAYIAERTDVKKSTKKKWKPTHESLLKSFGEKTPLRQITPGDAEQWRRSLGTATRPKGALNNKLPN